MPSSPALNGTALAPDSATSNSVLAPSASHAHVPSHTPSHNTQSHNESPSHHESSQSDIGASSVPPAPAAVAEASPGSLAHTATAAMRPVSTTQAAALHSSSTSSKLPEQTGSNTLDASAAAGDLSTAGMSPNDCCNDPPPPILFSQRRWTAVMIGHCHSFSFMSLNGVGTHLALKQVLPMSQMLMRRFQNQWLIVANRPRLLRNYKEVQMTTR